MTDRGVAVASCRYPLPRDPPRDADTMPKPTHHHDALFRALLDDPGRAATLLREQLPAALAARLTADAPRLLDGSYIDEHLRDTQSDRLYQVTLTGGKPALLYILLEHKSAPDPGTPLQLLGYLVRIWTRYAAGRASRLRRLPPILPLVFYHGRQPWNIPTSILECLDIAV